MPNFDYPDPDFSKLPKPSNEAILTGDTLLQSYETDRNNLASNVMTYHELFKTLGAREALYYWDFTVVPDFAQRGYEGTRFEALRGQAITTVREWHEQFSHLPTVEPVTALPETATEPISNRRLDRQAQISYIIGLLKAAQEGALPDEHYELMDEVLDYAKRRWADRRYSALERPAEGLRQLDSNRQVLDWAIHELEAARHDED